MINISASTLKDMLVCSQRVYFRLNYPEESVKSREMILGDIVHKAIELFPFDREGGIEYIESVSTFGSGTALNLYDTYHESFKHLVKDGDIVEQFFKIKIEDDVNLVGKMDRINLQDGIVIDWKTGNTTPANISNDIQFILYDFAYRKLFNKTPNLLCMASLRSGKLVRYNENKVFVEHLFSSVIPKAISTLKSNNYAKEGLYSFTPRGDLSTACSYCSFKGFCLEE